MRIDGGCHCGAVRFEAEVDEGGVSVCHCTDCQSLTGTAFRVSVAAVDGTVRVVAGAPRVYVKVADNGARREQHFCGDCGSPLLTREEGRDGGWHVRWGAIAQRDALGAPRRAIWRRSAAPWLGGVAGLPGPETE